jgi:hypothetical protein
MNELKHGMRPEMHRYQIVELARKTKGFSAVIVDNKHPSGVSGIPIQWFVSTEAAAANLQAAGRTFDIIKEVVKTSSASTHTLTMNSSPIDRA